MLAITLIASNVASAAYQPLYDLYEPRAADRPALAPADLAAQRPHRFILRITGDHVPGLTVEAEARMRALTDLQVDYHDLFDGDPRVLNIAVDGTLVERCAMEVEGYAQRTLPEVIFQESTIGESTIDFKPDGSIIGSVGRPGKTLSQLRQLRPPSFSFLEWRLPLIGSAGISALALFLTLRRLSRGQLRRLIVAVALVAINIPLVLACLPAEPPRLLSKTCSNAEVGELYYTDGTRHVYDQPRGMPKRVARIKRPNPSPRLASLGPVIAGPSITILVLGFMRRRNHLARRVDAIASSSS
ncbi:hypothetical protein [Aquisphaera insulae]|uniref:hypothetical protein n=1 Tax=Aquisphaera insulae TaxID=2712864 RepID=UPI0013E9C64F|nr:hypothetical protein [Aquisphaera insulae]